MNVLRFLADAFRGHSGQTRSFERSRVRFQVALEPLENRTSLSQVHVVLPPVAPVFGSTPAATIAPADSTKIEPKDPGGIELVKVARSAIT